MRQRRLLVHKNKRAERGQVATHVVLVLSFVLIAFAGLAIDYTHMWSKRQEVQGAADAVCQAGAMDLYLYALEQQTANMGFDPANYGVGGNFLCSAVPGAAPCIISKFNGFDPAVAANTIKLTFPGTVAGFTPPPASLGITYPYLQVDVTQDVPTFISQIVRGNTPVRVGGHATCGLTVGNGPVPLIVLHKTKPANANFKGALDITGNPIVKIIGGPQQSIHINSSDPTAFAPGGTSLVDLRQGGPANQGSDLAVYGGPYTAPPQFVTTPGVGHYLAPYSPIRDPYALWPAPTAPPNGFATHVNFKVDGCPDPQSGCTEYNPGSYPGITVGTGGRETAIFKPGLYYLTGNFSLLSGATVRPSLNAGDGTGGTFFFFSGAGTLGVTSNSGKQSRCTGVNKNGNYTPPNCLLAYNPTGAADPLAGVSVSRALQCPGGGPNPSQLAGLILDGNIMLGTCGGISPGQSFNYGDPSGQYRGMLFFQDRGSAVDASWNGGGQFLLAGDMYFHQCKAGGGGIGCSNPGSGGYGTTLTMYGNAGSGTYTMGNITADALSLQGGSTITMILSPQNFPYQLFVQLMK